MKKEKFTPKSFYSKDKEMKPVPPEQLAKMEKEEEELKKEEKSKTIRLKRETTFSDLLDTEAKIVEKEQSWEEILPILEKAIESKSEIELTVLNLYGDSPRTAIITPHSIEKDLLWLTTENGCGIAIELSRIKRAVLTK